MKKIVAFAIALVMLSTCFMLSSCSLIETGDIEIAMVTDGESVSESSMNRAVWISVAEFAVANGKQCHAYHPKTQAKEDLVDAIMQAVVNGAKVVVCSGRFLEEAVFEVQDLFPGVRFILLDGEPRGVETVITTPVTTVSSEDGQDSAPEGVPAVDATATEQVKISDNVYCITFREDQSAYLAGYISVRAGYTKFGFVSESDSDTDMMYAVGFLNGVQDAAREMGIVDRVSVKFRYSTNNARLDGHVRGVVEPWYMTGTELVFASGYTCQDVIKAAEAKNGRVICTDSDHASISNLVVTSAVKLVSNPITEALTSLYNNDMKWDEAHSGKSVELGVAEDAVGLPSNASSWRFGNYTIMEYEALVAKIVAVEIVVDRSFNIFDNHDITIDFVS